MASRSAKYYSVKLALAGVAVFAVGWLLGYPLLALLIFLAAYGIWNLVNIIGLSRWLNSPDADVPNSFGMWSQIFSNISKLRKTGQKKKRQYKAVIQDFQSLTDALPDATLVLDKHNTITWFNNTAKTLLRLKFPDDLGQPVNNLLRGPDFTNWLAVQDDVKSKLVMTSPADENVWLSISAVDYRKGQRLMILQDITEVQNINQVRRDFVANISHELRSPLTVLVGYLEMLQDTDDETSRIAGRMQTQARQMQELLSNLLELSRLQADSTFGEDEEIDIPAMIAQLREQMDEISRGRHQIEVHAERGLHLLGISSDVESAFRNLIVNALNYTPEGGKIEVRWEAMPDGAEFSVTDSGIGIPKRDIPRLTERFYRVADDRSRSSGGTGLGLAIVKHVLNAHQAKLQIESELGEGSEFRCIFPADRIRVLAHHQ
jgi:two-component system phosphate regulon sensor histidine kinase PhoR